MSAPDEHGWLLIGDEPDKSSAPWDGKPILLAVTGGESGPVVGEAYWYDGDREADSDFWWANSGPGDYWASPIRDIQDGTITHWQPLPKPPVSP